MKEQLLLPIKKLRRWDGVTAITVTIGSFFVSQILGLIIFVMIFAVTGGDVNAIDDRLRDSPGLTMLLSLCIYGLYLLLVRSFLHWCGHRLRQVGLKMPERTYEIPLYIFIGYVVYFLGALIATAIVGSLIPSVNLEQKQDIGINTQTTGVALVFVFVTLVILPPIVEEIVTRGFLYTGLRKNFKMIGAGLITGVIFATAHLEWGNDAPLLWAAAIDTFILSAVLVYIREKTDSLYPAIGLHMVKNFLAFLALFIFHVA